ncbi:MAG TPA: FliM/FliN family flagellar motor switch protein [Bryobacteraceae bacterium]|nr:FliM/FliN family flagellar motor switch protein [Bryobacteraceae bacterium]
MTAFEEIAHLADVPLDVNAELDCTTMTVRNILDLDGGSVIRMHRSAGENIDLLFGGTVLGSGEIVIIEDAVGVRITDFREES